MSDTDTNTPNKKPKIFPKLCPWLSLDEQHDTMLELLGKLDRSRYETFHDDIFRMWMEISPEEEDLALRRATKVDHAALAEALNQVYDQIYGFLLGLIDDEDGDRWDEVEDLWNNYFGGNILPFIREVFKEKHITDGIIDRCPKNRVKIHELILSEESNDIEPKALARLLEKVPDVMFMRETTNINMFGSILFNNHDRLKVVCVALVRQWRALDEVKCLLVDNYGLSNKCYYDLVSSFVENPLLYRQKQDGSSVLHDLVKSAYCITQNYPKSTKLIEFLLKWAPNKDQLLEATDSNGKTPYDIAQEHGKDVDEHILKLLSSAKNKDCMEKKCKSSL